MWYGLKATYDVIKSAVAGKGNSHSWFTTIQSLMTCVNSWPAWCYWTYPLATASDLLAEAGVDFGGEVCSDCQWDASSPVRNNVDKIEREKYEYRWAIRVTAHEMIYETVFGNISYGYLGMRVGFGAGLLQKAGGAFDWLKGYDDSGNWIQRQMGIDLYKRRPYTVTERSIYNIIVYGLYYISHAGVNGLADHTRYACPYNQRSYLRAKSGWPC